ncbi:hypothetical protein [Streptomyces sp. NPDC053367]|uniref:hypothetical protein n=1 Tax=Streptomyces sp. NPDC053367 TaxID=3365700 RepID=UPI0037D30F15
MPADSCSEGRVTVVLITRDRPAALRRTLDELAALPERPAGIVMDICTDVDTLEVGIRGR